MSDHPFPQDEPHGQLVCIRCDHIFTDRIPPLCVELPPCPLCEAPSWVYQVPRVELMSQQYHYEDDDSGQPEAFG